LKRNQSRTADQRRIHPNRKTPPGSLSADSSISALSSDEEQDELSSAAMEILKGSPPKTTNDLLLSQTTSLERHEKDLSAKRDLNLVQDYLVLESSSTESHTIEVTSSRSSNRERDGGRAPPEAKPELLVDGIPLVDLEPRSIEEMMV
jgi:hypothetical protein